MTIPSSVAGPTPTVPFVRRRYSVASIVGELWRARDLVTQLVRRDLTLRYTQAVMGVAWAVLMPLLIVGAGLVLRLVIATLSNATIGGASVASLAVRALPWAFFAGALSTATQSLISHANLIGKVYFPRESLPLASVLAQAPDLAVGLVVVVLVLPILGVRLPWTSLWAVAMLLRLVVFTTGCALMLSCANLFFRDVKYIVQVVLNFGVFATPVFFEPQMLGRKGAAVMLALPLSPFIQAMDVAMIRGHNLLTPLTVETAKGPIAVWAPWMLGYAAGIALLTVTAGLLIFRRASSRFAEMA